MKDLLASLDKKLTTLKISFKGEICRIRFIDGVHLNVDSQRFGLRYMGKIENIGEQIISIRFLTPVKEVKDLKGKEAEVSFLYKKDFYYFTSTILEHKENMLLVTKPTEIKKTQRREFYRLPLTIPVNVKKVYNSKMDVAIFKDYFEQGITSKDISSGGLRMEKDYIAGLADSGIEFVSSQNIEKNSVVELELSLPRIDKKIVVICKVAWIQKVAQKYEIGVSFYDLSRENLELIHNYVTSNQVQPKKRAVPKKARKKR
jgi:c-di-GMP-binding flagellar brake protein YcgR